MRLSPNLSGTHCNINAKEMGNDPMFFIFAHLADKNTTKAISLVMFCSAI